MRSCRGEGVRSDGNSVCSDRGSQRFGAVDDEVDGAAGALRIDLGSQVDVLTDLCGRRRHRCGSGHGVRRRIGRDGHDLGRRRRRRQEPGGSAVARGDGVRSVLGEGRGDAGRPSGYRHGVLEWVVAVEELDGSTVCAAAHVG